LCRRIDQPLQRSHYLPAGVFRATRDETQTNPDPIRIGDDAVLQDSRQITDYLLCRACEQRLNGSGERWFLAHCCRKDQFPLRSMLDGASPVESLPRIMVYCANRINKVNIKALTNFAASMFWRASAHQWKMAGTKRLGIALGPYEEELRKFLLGEAEFPTNCVLWVSVPNSLTPFLQLSLTPYGGRKDNYHLYKLVVLGVGFHLLVGRSIPRDVRSLCFVSAPGNPICRTDMLEEAIIQDVVHKFHLHPRLLDGPGGVKSRASPDHGGALGP
jgi:hypothetical protein